MDEETDSGHVSNLLSVTAVVISMCLVFWGKKK